MRKILQSSQAQDYSCSGENVMNLEVIKKDLLNSENSSIISASPPALCTNTSSPENSSAYKCNSLSLESTQDREILDILEELQNQKPCITTFFLYKHEGKFTPASIMLSFLRISGSSYAYDMLNISFLRKF